MAAAPVPIPSGLFCGVARVVRGLCCGVGSVLSLIAMPHTTEGPITRSTSISSATGLEDATARVDVVGRLAEMWTCGLLAPNQQMHMTEDCLSLVFMAGPGSE
uniref:Uncharacterized protein n=1 Tax=Eutreptiella gymnastica TaxID=73025 RepID=A0A7S4FNQ1_9EUGL